jgi:hypothetical protein
MGLEFAFVLPIVAMFGYAVFSINKEVQRVDAERSRLLARLQRIYEGRRLQLVRDDKTGVYFPLEQTLFRLEN